MLKLKQKMTATQGFTLVELSIVIIIIGFLIAGIAAGTSLIKQAEINSVVTDFQAYQTAYNNFLGRYSQAPGDFSAGSSVWATCAATAANCQGNGNGIIDTAVESVASWRELSLAGMISSGIGDPDDATTPLTLGTDAPLSKVSGGGYMMVQGDDTLLAVTGLWSDGKTNAVFLPSSAIF